MSESVKEAAGNFWSKWPMRGGMYNARLANRPFRSSNGGHWGPLSEAFVDTLAMRGVDPSWIRAGRDATLPGAYGLGRSAWDLVVLKDGIPLGAIIFKSQDGLSVGKNFNNRIQELTSIAYDVRRQYNGQELYKLQPYLGLIFILEEGEYVNRRVKKQHDSYARLGDGLTYKERMSQTFKQLCSDGLYDGVVYIMSSRAEIPSFEELCPEMSVDGFVADFAKRVLSLADTQRAAGITAVTFGEMLSRRGDTHEVVAGLKSSLDDELGNQSGEDSGLIFRAYVPCDRLYASELGNFLSLFRSWLSNVRGHGIRQGGYETKSGRVYEFYLNNDSASIDLDQERDNFSNFLALCIADPSATADRLVQDGMGRSEASSLASTYCRRIRKLNLDLKQERERRILEIWHDIESNLIDSDAYSEISLRRFRDVLEVFVPDLSINTYQNILEGSGWASHAGIEININQQVIRAVEGTVIQNVSGIVNLAPQAKELLALIDAYGGQAANSLRTAVFEVEDKDAPLTERRQAKKRLMKFLNELGTIVRDLGVDLLEKYLESKIGLGR